MSVVPMNEPEQEQSPQLRIPHYEGLVVNRVVLAFSGSLEVDDQKLVDLLRLNHDVELVVSGRLLGSGHKVKLDGDGYLEETHKRVVLRVESMAPVGGDE